MDINTELRKLTTSLFNRGVAVAQAGINDARYNPSTRRQILETGGKVVAGAVLVGGAAYIASRLPLAYAQEEQVEARVATNPLGPEDLKNGNWLKPEYWDGTCEYAFMPHTSQKYGFFRLLDSEHPNFPNLAILVDSVTDTSEKPFSEVSLGFDTYNMRYQIKDPGVPGTPGYYSAFIAFRSSGNPVLYDAWAGNPLAPGHPFPSGKIRYTWARGSSPIPGNDENRLKDHFLEAIMIDKKLLTEKANEIGFRMTLHQTSSNDLEFSPGKLVFSGIPVPEIPWPALALGGTVGVAALATRKMSRRQLIFPWSK
jgi:hypothetical protein